MLRTSVYTHTCACSCVRDALCFLYFPSPRPRNSSAHSLIHSLTHALTHLSRCRSGSPQSWPRPWPAGLSWDSSHAGTCQSALSEPAPWPRFLLLAVRRTSYETAERAAQINPTATRLHFQRAAAGAAAASPPTADSEKTFQNKSGLTSVEGWEKNLGNVLKGSEWGREKQKQTTASCV